jgi:hypothetical protein
MLNEIISRAVGLGEGLGKSLGIQYGSETNRREKKCQGKKEIT